MTTILRKHVDRYMHTDSCRLHGIGVSVCRVCMVERYTPRHRANMETLVGTVKMRMGY